MLARTVDKSCFLPSPATNNAVHAASYYTTRDGMSLISCHGIESRSDTIDLSYVRHSTDNGATWGPAIEWPTAFQHPAGTGRRHPRGYYVDPATDRLISLWSEGVLPSDHPLEGMFRWTLRYAVSADGGHSQYLEEQIIHEGDAYNELHHLPGVTVGHNCVMMGDLGERPLTRSDGVILIPVQSSPVGPDGFYHNPGKGFTFTDAMILMGRWRPDGGLAWTASERIACDPARSTRGMIEPTLAELPDGRLLCVMRGSNDACPDLPGHKWHAYSEDGGQTWTSPEPWTYTDGEAFFSPSACSQLIPWRDGRILWLGNICAANPRGNSPRYPLVVVEVDPASGLVRRNSVSVVDDRQPGENERLTLSNFYAREDRETGQLLIHLTRLFAQTRLEPGKEWTADATLLRVDID